MGFVFRFELLLLLVTLLMLLCLFFLLDLEENAVDVEEAAGEEEEEEEENDGKPYVLWLVLKRSPPPWTRFRAAFWAEESEPTPLRAIRAKKAACAFSLFVIILPPG